MSFLKSSLVFVETKPIMNKEMKNINELPYAPPVPRIDTPLLIEKYAEAIKDANSTSIPRYDSKPTIFKDFFSSEFTKNSTKEINAVSITKYALFIPKKSTVKGKKKIGSSNNIAP
jgi:hypothetical protein